MIVEKCGRSRCKNLFISEGGINVNGTMICPACAELLDTLLQSRPFTGGLIIAALPLGERKAYVAEQVGDKRRLAR